MAEAEVAASEVGKTLLVLDTASDDAERVYGRMGWQRVGVIPGYALWPDGGPVDTVVFYKTLATDRSRCCRPNRLGGRPSGYVAITTVSQVEVRLRCHRKDGAPSAATVRAHQVRLARARRIGGHRREIAARTVNKERARAGEATRAQPQLDRRHLLRSTRWASFPPRRWRAHPDQLYNEARSKGIKGRSKMTKAQLERAVGR